MKRLFFTLGIVLVAAQLALAQSPAPAPAPSGELIRFSGQLLDTQQGYVIFTTGDAFKLADDAKIVDAKTGAPTARAVGPRTYARASFDASGAIVELALSPKPLPSERAYAEIKRFAIAASPVQPNPDLVQKSYAAGGHIALTGKIVSVKFVVRVPPITRQDDAVYMATDASGWNAQAVRLERIDGLRYSVTIPLRTGTEFAYKFTRGSWNSAERGRTGLDEPPHKFFLGAAGDVEPDAKTVDNAVANWSDENPGAPNVGPNAIPTPFNPRPFGFPGRAATSTPRPHP